MTNTTTTTNTQDTTRRALSMVEDFEAGRDYSLGLNSHGGYDLRCGNGITLRTTTTDDEGEILLYRFEGGAAMVNTGEMRLLGCMAIAPVLAPVLQTWMVDAR